MKLPQLQMRASGREVTVASKRHLTLTGATIYLAKSIQMSARVHQFNKFPSAEAEPQGDTIMTTNHNSRLRKKKRQRKSNHPSAKNPKAAFVPREIDETAEFEGQFIAIVGGVQPPKKTKAAFEPTVTDETVPGECTGIIGVSIPPKKTTRQRS